MVVYGNDKERYSNPKSVIVTDFTGFIKEPEVTS
jgi:hypothetical protein